MFWWLSELLSCLKFIAITGNRGFFQSKRVYEFVVPGVAAFAAAAIYLLLPTIFAPSFLKTFSASVFQVMVFVVPFHLAALAALSTYQSVGLNEKLPGSEAQIRLWSNADNGYFFHEVTLRQYASLLFGYLCSLGIVYVVIYMFAAGIDLSPALTAAGQFTLVYNAVLFASFFFVFHYGTLTVYAITFLFDKVNKIKAT
ncbi:hypothetical protein SAMN05216330_1184 [Bradyrhizobium sp. Ghvi]|uniref:hypothetical protein n=1 Tax=Bradyrhizobium sp. Ghvi TaxID=1855319 RepID=UPI0008EBBEBF|nr:hypothetical protein [Bradyrhizobium sp. Ghvi]SFQ17896.1 hypothetical protein SAMN05216330_1184 [Bradyrhizobium sp. Ghvi]